MDIRHCVSILTPKVICSKLYTFDHFILVCMYSLYYMYAMTNVILFSYIAVICKFFI